MNYIYHYFVNARYFLKMIAKISYLLIFNSFQETEHGNYNTYLWNYNIGYREIFCILGIVDTVVTKEGRKM